ncbi:MAG: hypothetical protein WA666_01730 [Nitrospirota bacterium]
MHKIFKISTAVFAILLADAGSAWAVQPHTGPEGYYAHQAAHLLFIFSMVYLIVLLGKPTLRRLSGWQYIRLASVFFLLWNVDAFISHIMEWFMVPREKYFRGSWMLMEDLKSEVYYVTRLIEYFFLLPAFLFMALGVRRLKGQLEREKE